MNIIMADILNFKIKKMNKIILSGFIGKDAEVSKFEWGEVMKFTLATTESYTTKSGEKKSDTTWHNIEKIGNNLDNFARYLKKGVSVEVIGRQEHRRVDEKYFSAVRAETISFCPAKKDASSNAQASSAKIPDLPPENNNVGDDDLPF